MKSLTLLKHDDKWYISIKKNTFIICLMLSLGVLVSGVGFTTYTLIGISRPQAEYLGGTLEEWLNAFVKKDFNTCDTMVEKVKDKLVDEHSLRFRANDTSLKMYKDMISACAGCIKEVSVVHKDGNNYTIKTVYSPVIKNDSILLDKDGLTKVTNLYLEEKVPLEGFQEQLQSLYYDSFNKTVLSSNSNTTNTDVFTIKQGENGKVKNVYKYVTNLLKKTNLYGNMKLYEEDVKSTFTVIMNKE